jgi:hypothetical protein
MTRLIPARYINPHALTGVRARGRFKLARFIGQPCPYCGVPMGSGEPTLPSRDHKIPVSRVNHPFAPLGGAFLLARENIHICCRGCNSDKGSLDHEEYLAVLQGLASRLDKGYRPGCPPHMAVLDEKPA